MPKTRKSWWWIALAIVVVGTATLGHHARPARAQAPRVTVEFWHGLAAAARRHPREDRHRLQRSRRPSTGSTPPSRARTPRPWWRRSPPSGRATRRTSCRCSRWAPRTMMSARGAIKPVHELMKETGVAFDPDALPARRWRGYYSLPDGRMMSMPFNSSTTIMFYNKDAFKKAGLDPEQAAPDLGRAPGGGPEDPGGQRDALRLHHRVADLGAVRAVQRHPQRAAGHQGQRPRRAGRGAQDQQPAARAARADPDRHAEGRQLQVRRPRRGGRRAVPLRASARSSTPPPGCAPASCARRKFEWGAAMLPYYPGTPDAPKNSIIGGASLLGDDLARAASPRSTRRWPSSSASSASPKWWPSGTSTPASSPSPSPATSG